LFASKAATSSIRSNTRSGPSARDASGAAEFCGLAEQRGAAVEPGKQVCEFAELPAHIGLVVRTDQRKAEAVVVEGSQHRIDAGEERDIGDMLGLQPPHVPRDARQLPQRDVQSLEDFAGAGMAQRLNVLISNAAKAKAIGNIVHVAQEPGNAVGQRAVEVEDDEGIGHRGRKQNQGYSSREERFLRTEELTPPPRSPRSSSAACHPPSSAPVPGIFPYNSAAP
jgi:hypothetical protein